MRSSTIDESRLPRDPGPPHAARMSGFTPPGECPVCGADVPAGAHACPDCGACADTGWSEETVYDGLDLPGQEEVARAPRSRSRAWLGAIALLTIVALVLVFILGRG